MTALLPSAVSVLMDPSSPLPWSRSLAAGLSPPPVGAPVSSLDRFATLSKMTAALAPHVLLSGLSRGQSASECQGLQADHYHFIRIFNLENIHLEFILFVMSLIQSYAEIFIVMQNNTELCKSSVKTFVENVKEGTIALDVDNGHLGRTQIAIFW